MSDVDWTTVASVDLPALLEVLSLHDSAWLQLSIHNGCVALLEIQLDRHGNPWAPEGFETLLLCFERTMDQRLSAGAWLMSSIESASSRRLGESDREALLEDPCFPPRLWQGAGHHEGDGWDVAHPALDPTTTRTTLELVSGGRLELLHGDPVRGVARHADGRLLDLATLLADTQGGASP